MPANGAAVFVIYDTARLVKNFPTALPSLVAEIGVFEIEGPEQLIEATQLQKLAAIECAGSAAPVKAGERFCNRGVNPMPDAQAAVLPPALRQPGFFPQFRRIAEENLARDREYLFVGESVEQRGEEIRLNAHVAIEQHDHVVFRAAKACIRRSSE